MLSIKKCLQKPLDQEPNNQVPLLLLLSECTWYLTESRNLQKVEAENHLSYLLW